MTTADNKKTIGVVGAGAMGRGIAQLFAEAGHSVILHDAFPGAAEKGRAFIAQMLERAVAKGRYSAEQGAAITDAVRIGETLAALAPCDLVVEAIIEEIDAKQQLFAALEEVVSEQALLASNTSSLVIAEIAANCRHPERLAGLHFFNPVPLMKVVEIIKAVRTAPATVNALRQLVGGTGHRAVIAADQPGFLVNHAGRGLYTEGLRLLEEQVADVAAIDTLLRDAAGFRMGPFELLDLTGLDVSGKVMTSIYEQFQQEPRFRPSALVPPRIAAGLHGRKSGEGWYRYDDNKRVEPAPIPVPALPAGLRVWIDPAADEATRLAELAQAAGAATSSDAATADLLLIQGWGIDASGYCAEHGLDARRCVAIDPLPGLGKRRTLMLTAITGSAARDAAHALLAADGTPVTVINDSAGFVLQRVLATIVNIAANIAQRGIASVADIEAAVQLGLGYPRGPLSWGDAIGGERVLLILDTLLARTGDPRYRASPWLRRRVALGLSLLTEEASR